MKNKTLILAVCMLAGIVLAGHFGPWWAPAVFIVIMTILSGMNAKQGATAGAAALSLVYLGLATVLHLQDDTGILQKTGVLLGNLSPNFLVVITTFLGTITGALAGWLGGELGPMFRKKPQKTEA